MSGFRVANACLAAGFCSALIVANLSVRAAAPTPAQSPPAEAGVTDQPIDVDVVRSRADLLGTAASASQGAVTQEELALRPVYRVGQLLESVPGLVVTLHSGEAKANQFFIRGFNLDHGTDFATFIDDVPYNEPTHAHGQGYTLLGSFIPEMADGLDYTKGPFYPQVGDFAGLGSAHIRLTDDLPNFISVSGGTLGDERVSLGGTLHLDNGDRLIAMGAIAHLDGPWVHPDNFQGLNGTMRYVHGDRDNGFDITVLAFRSQSNFTTDQPVSAFQDGLISRFGNLNPSDGAFNQRYSLAGHYYISGDNWKWTTNAYVVNSRLTLWNDFTHYLVDPVHGDQEQQDETRFTEGGQTAFIHTDVVAGIPTETEIGLQGRHDSEYIDRRHDEDRVVLPDCPDSPFGGGLYVCNADNVTLGNVAAYIQNTTRWLPWFRTAFSLREDYVGGTDHSLVTGFTGQVNKTLLEPKGSLIFGPFYKTEFYVNAGRGFHTNDLRGVLGTVPDVGAINPNLTSSLITKIDSEEVGVRTDIIPRTHLTAALFTEHFASYLTYDADNGVDDVGPPARLTGVEVSAQYKPLDWLELNGDVNFTHSRYLVNASTEAYYGVPGAYIPNAPDFIGSFGAIVDRLGPWFGGVAVRWLGTQPLVGDNSLTTPGYKEVNLSVGYRINDHMRVLLNVFNLFNTNAAASQYAYEYRVSPTAAPQFGPTYHELEPLSARLTLTATF
jgi:outer membrane receptor protein involved in Fe transport